MHEKLLSHLYIRGKVTGLYNCHVMGLHSLMLQDEPGNRIRMFVATSSHQLHPGPGDEDMPLAVHPHHCDVTLINLYGAPVNHIYRRELGPGSWDRCSYSSGVTGTPSLKVVCRDIHLARQERHYLNKEGTFMPASTLHAISVPVSSAAAWLVLEGQEDPNYESYCYTKNPKFDPTHLYQPMDKDEASEMLRSVIERMRK